MPSRVQVAAVRGNFSSPWNAIVSLNPRRLMSTETTPEEVEGAEEQQQKLTLEVKVEKIGACERHVTVTIAREDINRYFKTAFDELSPKAEIPGFRAGRAPRKIVESRFKDQMKNQVKGSLLMDSMSQVNEEQQFSAISEPDFDFDAIEVPDDGPLTFEFDLEVRPEFATPVWKGLSLEKPVRDYNDEDITRHLKNVLRRFSHVEPYEGAAELDDYLVCNLTFKKDGETLATASEQTICLKPTLSLEDAKLEDFDKLMVGVKEGDRKTATVKVSDGCERESLRGQEVEIEFEVLEVKRLVLPQMTRAFLDSIGGFQSEEELRTWVKGELVRQLRYYQQKRVREQIAGILTESASWELPPALVKRQFRRELNRSVMELKSSGFNEEVIRAHENEIKQNSARSTERALKEHFILEKIAEEEKIDAEPGDYDAEIALIAEQSDESPRRVRARLEKRGEMDSLRNQIIESKVIDLISANSIVTEVPFVPPVNQTEALEISVAVGDAVESQIPEAKPGDTGDPDFNKPKLN
jgi:trigger factor